MNERLIQNWNQRVKPEDTVFHLGDFCFKNSIGGKKGEGQITKANEWENQLNGKIILIRGNHDKNNSAKTIITGLEVFYCNRVMWLTHKPEHINLQYKLNLVGHIHEKQLFGFSKDKATIWINVGVDVWNFMPINIQQILKLESKIRKGYIK